MRFILALVFWIVFVPAAAQEWEDVKTFGPETSASKLRIISSTDTSFFAPIIESYLVDNPNVAIEYYVQGTANIDEIFRKSQNEFDLVISSAMDLQFKLVNDGFALTLPAIDHANWAQWRSSLFAFTTEPAAIVINRAAFDGYDIPKTREDLILALRARPEIFRNKLATYDVRRSGLGYLFATQDARTSETYWRLMEIMGGVGTSLYCCSGEMIDDLIKGEIFVAYNVLGSYATARMSEDNSIAVILPADFPTTMMRTIMVSKATDKPDLATSFIRHLIEFQSNGQDNMAVSLPPLMSQQTQSTIPLEPALMTYLDKLKRETFIAAWEHAIIQ